jgi:hypothetical protein
MAPSTRAPGVSLPRRGRLSLVGERELMGSARSRCFSERAALEVESAVVSVWRGSGSLTLCRQVLSGRWIAPSKVAAGCMVVCLCRPAFELWTVRSDW